MAKRSKRKRRNRPPRQDGQPKDRERAEMEARLRAAKEPPRDPAGVLTALQANPPRVQGHVAAEVERKILE